MTPCAPRPACPHLVAASEGRGDSWGGGRRSRDPEPAGLDVVSEATFPWLEIKDLMLILGYTAKLTIWEFRNVPLLNEDFIW